MGRRDSGALLRLVGLFRDLNDKIDPVRLIVKAKLRLQQRAWKAVCFISFFHFLQGRADLGHTKHVILPQFELFSEGCCRNAWVVTCRGTERKRPSVLLSRGDGNAYQNLLLTIANGQKLCYGVICQRL